MEQRLVELEKKLMFQEHALEELQDIVNDQQKTIKALQKELTAVHDKMNQEALTEPHDASDEKPPHY